MLEFEEPIKKLEPSWFGLPILINDKYLSKKKKFLSFLNKNGIETIPTFFDDLFTLTYFQKDILNELNKKQKEIYLSNFLDSNKYRYPERFISFPVIEFFPVHTP